MLARLAGTCGRDSDAAPVEMKPMIVEATKRRHRVRENKNNGADK